MTGAGPSYGRVTILTTERCYAGGIRRRLLQEPDASQVVLEPASDHAEPARAPFARPDHHQCFDGSGRSVPEAVDRAKERVAIADEEHEGLPAQPLLRDVQQHTGGLVAIRDDACDVRPYTSCRERIGELVQPALKLQCAPVKRRKLIHLCLQMFVRDLELFERTREFTQRWLDDRRGLNRGVIGATLQVGQSADGRCRLERQNLQSVHGKTPCTAGRK